MAKKTRSKRTEALIKEQRRLVRALKKEGKVNLNEYLVARSSKIHGTGVFARKDIKKGTTLIEYVGEKIGKREAEKRSEEGKSVYLKIGIYLFQITVHKYSAISCFNLFLARQRFIFTSS